MPGPSSACSCHTGTSCGSESSSGLSPFPPLLQNPLIHQRSSPLRSSASRTPPFPFPLPRKGPSVPPCLGLAGHGPVPGCRAAELNPRLCCAGGAGINPLVPQTDPPSGAPAHLDGIQRRRSHVQEDAVQHRHRDVLQHSGCGVSGVSGRGSPGGCAPPRTLPRETPAHVPQRSLPAARFVSWPFAYLTASGALKPGSKRRSRHRVPCPVFQRAVGAIRAGCGKHNSKTWSYGLWLRPCKCRGVPATQPGGPGCPARLLPFLPPALCLAQYGLVFSQARAGKEGEGAHSLLPTDSTRDTGAVGGCVDFPGSRRGTFERKH